MNEFLVACYEHNRWANLLLADACLAADPAILDRGLEGTFGPIRATMAHVAGAEARYLRPLQGVDRFGVPRFEEGAPDMAAIREELARTGAELIEAERSAVPGSTVRVARNGEWLDLPTAMFMVQGLDHAKEHRTQVAAILTQQGVTPPDMDGWSFYGVE
ncbi:MAG: DinB family protein [Thermomicrobiales bacterium]